MRILLIVNDPDLVVAQPYLTLKPGDEILQIAPSAENQEQIRQIHPDLVLVDPEAREIRARELADQVHDDLSLRNIPVMLVPGLETQLFSPDGEPGAHPGEPAGASPAQPGAATAGLGQQWDADCSLLERQILDSLDQAVVVTGLDGKIVYWNRFAEQLYGIPADKVLDRTSEEVLGRRSHFYQEQVIPHLKSGKRWTMEYYVRGQDRRMRPVLLTITPLFDSAGELVGITEIATDISERKENDSRYQRALFNAPFPVVIHAEDGEVIMINRAWTELSGFEPGHMPRMEDWVEKAFPINQRDEMLRRIGQQFNSGERVVEGGENEVRTLRGRQRTWRFSSAPLGRTLDGRRTMISMAVDLTDRREAEDQLQRAVSDAPFPIMIHAEDGQVILLNRMWRELTGYDLDDIPTVDDWMQKAYGERLPEVMEIIRQQYDVNRRVSLEDDFVIDTKDGRQRIWNFSSAPLGYTPDGRRLVMASATDVTERRAVEKRFERAVYDSPYPIILYAEDGEILLINHAWTELAGYDLDDIPTIQDWTEKAYREKAAKVQAIIQSVKPSEGHYHVGEFHIYTRDGRVRVWDFSTSSLDHLPDGRRIRMSIANDITDRIEVERRFELALQYAPFPLAIYAEDGQFLMLNEAFQEYSGYALADLPDLKTWLDKALRARYPLIEQWVHQLYAHEGRVHKGEFAVCTRDGRERVWDIDGAWLGRLPDGRRLRMFMAVDLTDRKEMEQRFAQAVRYAPFPLSIFAEDGEMLLLNQSFTDLTGYTLLELPQRSDYLARTRPVEQQDVTLPGQAFSANASPLPASTGQAPGQASVEMFAVEPAGEPPEPPGEVIFETRSGRSLLWDTTTVPIGHLPDGRRLYMSMAADITERQQVEQRFRRAVEYAPFPAMIHAEDGQVLLLNQAFERISGYSLDDIPTLETYAERFYGERKEAVLATVYAGYKAGGQFQGGELVLDTRTGRQRVWDFMSVDLGRLPDGRRTRLAMAADVTERKGFEEALRESESKYRSLVESSNLGLLVYQDQRVVFANPAFTRLLGLTPQDIEGHPLEDLMAYIDPADRPMAADYILQTGQGQLPAAFFDLRMRSASGQLCWVEASLHPVEYQGCPAVQSLLVDISDRKKAEDALKESEDRYRQVVEHSTMLIATLAQGRVVYINPAGAHLLGFETAEDVMGHQVEELVHPDSYARLLPVAQELHLDQPSGYTSGPVPGPALFIEEEIIRQNGSRVVLGGSVNFLSVAGQPVIHIIAQDFTLRRQAREALRRQAALAQIDLAISRPEELADGFARAADITCQTLQVSLGVVLVLWDPDSGVLRLAASSLRDEHAAILERLLAATDSLSAFIIQEKKPWIVQDVAEDAYDPHYFAGSAVRSYVATPVMVDQQVRGVLYILEDHPYAFEYDSLEFIDALATRLSMAMAKVDLYEGIRAARDAAEEAARTKADFLANMSHELRTPLTTITTLAELLMESQLDGGQLNYMRTILNSAGRLLDLINHVLDFSRLEAHKLSLAQHPFDLRRCIEAALDLVAVSAAAKGLLLEYSAAPDLPNQLVGDALQLGQVLTNLVSNAVKFTEAGFVTLNVDLVGPVAGGLSEFRFTVQDSGIGIPPDRIPLLFQPFSQVDTSPTRKYAGTGLGLVISKHIVELMNGRIWVESDGHSGSSFSFTVQLKVADEEPAAYLKPDLPFLAGKSVLILTHSHLARKTLQEWLTYWGARPVIFFQPAQALHWLQLGNRPDLLMADAAFLIAGQPEGELYPYLSHDWQHPAGDAPAGLPRLVALVPFSEQAAFPPALSSLSINPMKLGTLYSLLASIFTQALDQIPETFDYPEPGLPDQRSLQVLLAEDDPLNRQALTLRLQRLGYEVNAVSNGLEVIQAIASGRYDIVFMDFQMPEMDGLSTIRYLRGSYPADRQPFIIGLTADARQETRQALLEAGANLFLTKPVKGDDLALALHQAAERFRTNRRASRLSNWVAWSSRHRRDDSVDETVFQELVSSIGTDSSRDILVILELFFENSQKMIASIQDSLVAQNWVQLRHDLHTLKGSVELLGATRLGKHCKRLELALLDEQTADMPEQIELLRAEYEAVRQALEARYQQFVAAAGSARQPEGGP